MTLVHSHAAQDGLEDVSATLATRPVLIAFALLLTSCILVTLLWWDPLIVFTATDLLIGSITFWIVRKHSRLQWWFPSMWLVALIGLMGYAISDRSPEWATACIVLATAATILLWIGLTFATVKEANDLAPGQLPRTARIGQVVAAVGSVLIAMQLLVTLLATLSQKRLLSNAANHPGVAELAQFVSWWLAPSLWKTLRWVVAWSLVIFGILMGLGAYWSADPVPPSATASGLVMSILILVKNTVLMIGRFLEALWWSVLRALKSFIDLWFARAVYALLVLVFGPIALLAAQYGLQVVAPLILRYGQPTPLLWHDQLFDVLEFTALTIAIAVVIPVACSFATIRLEPWLSFRQAWRAWAEFLQNDFLRVCQRIMPGLALLLALFYFLAPLAMMSATGRVDVYTLVFLGLQLLFVTTSVFREWTKALFRIKGLTSSAKN